MVSEKLINVFFVVEVLVFKILKIFFEILFSEAFNH